MMSEEFKFAETKASTGLPTAEPTDTTAEPTPIIDFREDAPPTTHPAEPGEDATAQDEMERERLVARAEQLQDDITQLRRELHEKELELAEVKKELGITPFTEFKQSVSHGFKVMGDKWREVQDSETYQKTKASLSEGSKKASDALSSAGTRIKESETVKKIGSAASSLKTRVMASFDADSDSNKPEMEPIPDKKETVVPDEPTKKE